MTTAPARRVALAMLAHPDDAELQCGGTLALLAARGWQVHIATCTAGDCGSATLPPEEIAAVRRGEAAAAAALIGARYHCLEERDVRVVCAERSLRKAIDLMRAVSPTLVFAHPRHDYMLDHEQAHLLARGATFAFPIPNASQLPPAGAAQVPWLYYVDPLGGEDPYTGQEVAPSLLVDIAPAIGTKTAMLACHASQRDWLRAHHGIDEYLDGMRRHAARRGAPAGLAWAEAFVQHPGHPYPRHDLLAEELGGRRAIPRSAA